MTSELLKFEAYRSPAEIEKTWRDLQERIVHHPFQRFDWISTWTSTIGRDSGDFRFIVAYDRNGKAQAIFPIALNRRVGVRRLTWIGGNQGDYQGILASAEFYELFKSYDIVSLIRRLVPKVDLIDFNRGINNSVQSPNPIIPPRFSWQSTNAYLMHLPPEVEVFRSGQKMREDTARKRRKLKTLGLEKLDIATESGNREEITRFMMAHKERRYLETGHRNVFKNSVFSDFYLGLCSDPAIHISALRYGDKVVAAHWGALVGDRFYWIMPAYDGEYARCSPGRMHLHMLIEWCIGQAVRLFDFTVGDESYKRLYADEIIPLYSTRVPLTLKGRLFRRVAALLRK